MYLRLFPCNCYYHSLMRMKMRMKMMLLLLSVIYVHLKWYDITFLSIFLMSIDVSVPDRKQGFVLHLPSSFHLTDCVLVLFLFKTFLSRQLYRLLYLLLLLRFPHRPSRVSCVLLCPVLCVR